MPVIREYEERLSERLSELLQNAHELTNIKRIQCVYFRVEYGFSPAEIAEMVGYNTNYVEQIQARFWKEGEEIFKKKQKGGRNHANMTLEEEKEFLEQFREESLNGRIIEVSKFHEAYEEKLGRKVYRSVIYDLLDRNGWRKIMPRPRHNKNNKEKMENFKKGRVS